MKSIRELLNESLEQEQVNEAVDKQLLKQATEIFNQIANDRGSSVTRSPFIFRNWISDEDVDQYAGDLVSDDTITQEQADVLVDALKSFGSTNPLDKGALYMDLYEEPENPEEAENWPNDRDFKRKGSAWILNFNDGDYYGTVELPNNLGKEGLDFFKAMWNALGK